MANSSSYYAVLNPGTYSVHLYGFVGINGSGGGTDYAYRADFGYDVDQLQVAIVYID